MAELKKRVRMRAKTKEQVKKNQKYDLDTLSKEAAIARAALQKAEAELKLAESKLFDAMMETKTWSFHPDFKHDGQHIEGEFQVETPVGRSLTTIAPEKYFQLIDAGRIDHGQFFDSVSVKITEARKYLGEKEIDKIGTTKLPEKKDPVLKTAYLLVDGTPVFGKLPK